MQVLTRSLISFRTRRIAVCNIYHGIFTNKTGPASIFHSFLTSYISIPQFPRQSSPDSLNWHPMLNFTDYHTPDTDQMLFGPVDIDEYVLSDPQPSSVIWPTHLDLDPDYKSVYDPVSFSPRFGYDPSLSSPSDSSYYDGVDVYNLSLSEHSSPPDSHQFLPSWVNDQDLNLRPPSSPIPIPSCSHIPSSTLFTPPDPFSPVDPHSPPNLATTYSLPRSMSPAASDDYYTFTVNSASPPDTSVSAMDVSNPLRPVGHTPFPDSTIRIRPSYHCGLNNIFQSSSAPSTCDLHAPNMTRSYSRRSEPSHPADDNDGIVHRKKRISQHEAETKAPEPPIRSLLRPPKLAPSAWQLYFTDWIQKQQVSGARKLNVAQAAKEAGQEYALLTPEQKEPYKRRSQAAKEARERELAAYMRTLTPDDIRRENAFRTRQRKEGKSRRSNMKDPNAPKKPLSAYFMFLQRIRANPHLVRDIFGDETETTKQSVLAAAKWRSMTDAERQPFLAQAEQEKMEYEKARRIYEEGASSYSSSNINFSILPGSPFTTMRLESESESEG